MIEESLFATLRLDLKNSGWDENEIEDLVTGFDMKFVMTMLWKAYHLLLDDIGEKIKEEE
jgi:hypothetical protein